MQCKIYTAQHVNRQIKSMHKFFNLKNFKIFFYILLLYSLISLSLFVILLPDWIYKNFGNITIEQILFTLSLPLKGTSGELVNSFVKKLLAPSFICSSSLILIFLIIYNIKYFNNLILNKIYKLLTFAFKGLIPIYKKYTNSKTAKNFTKYSLISIVVFLFILLPVINFILPAKQNKFYYSNKQIINENCLIAHACGQIDGKNYTNSLEAITQSIEKGYKFIEIDLCITNDNEIVAMHDLGHFVYITGNKNLDNNFQDIIKQKIYGKYTPLTVEKINELFNKDKNLILVTDKISNFDILLNNFNFTDRMIVEVFSLKKYKEALRKGILYPALCIGRKEDFKVVIKENIRMVTTSIDFLKQNTDIFKYFHKKGVVIMVYGTPEINDEQILKNNVGVTCSLAYVDSVFPEDKEND